MAFKTLTVVEHPLVQHKLTILRDRRTPTAQFRQILREIAFVLGCEATRDLPLSEIEIETPGGPLRFTTSVGLSPLESPMPSYDTALKNADQALYAAKQAGRDQARIFEPDIPGTGIHQTM